MSIDRSNPSTLLRELVLGPVPTAQVATVAGDLGVPATVGHVATPGNNAAIGRAFILSDRCHPLGLSGQSRKQDPKQLAHEILQSPR